MISIAKNKFNNPIAKKICNRISGISNLISKRMLFPNPANGYFTIAYQLTNAFKTAQIVIFDISGKLVINQELKYDIDQIIIPTENWKSGQYSVSILTDGKTMVNNKITLVK
jgi:hypothetical protein